jgi:phosphonate transport system substrate-binding protein
MYVSDVIVHRDSPYRSFMYLGGRSWAYNEVLSHSGYGIHPELREAVRVVEALGPSTIQPVAVSKRLGDDLREAVRRALVSLHEDPEVRAGLAESLVERFVQVGPKDYADIRAMLAASEAAGFTRIIQSGP